MLSFQQLEKIYTVSSLIARYEQMIDQIDNGLHAANYDGSPRSSSGDPHRMDEMVIRKEKALEKLPALRGLRDDSLPLVEKTIAAVSSKCKITARLKVELILRMRYLNGMQWDEIEQITGKKHPDKLVQRLMDEV